MPERYCDPASGPCRSVVVGSCILKKNSRSWRYETLFGSYVTSRASASTPPRTKRQLVSSDKAEASRTAGAPRAYGAVAGALGVPTNVAYARIVQAVPLEGSAEHVLHAPEAACGDDRLGCTLRRAHAAARFRRETEARAGGERAEQTGYKGGHGSHEEN